MKRRSRAGRRWAILFAISVFVLLPALNAHAQSSEGTLVVIVDLRASTHDAIEICRDRSFGFSDAQGEAALDLGTAVHRAMGVHDVYVDYNPDDDDHFLFVTPHRHPLTDEGALPHE